MIHDFRERLAFSEGVEIEDGIFRLMREAIPGSTAVRRASRDDDLAGTDYWIDRPPLPSVSVDVKHRSFNPIQKYRSDDACIEVVSVYDGPRRPPWSPAHFRKPGWTVDPSKRTDLLLYTWPAPEDRRRFWLLYFPTLCAAARHHANEWIDAHGLKAAENDGYLTLSVYPTRAEIVQAIRKLTVGLAYDAPMRIAPVLSAAQGSQMVLDFGDPERPVTPPLPGVPLPDRWRDRGTQAELLTEEKRDE